jgi:formate/nitrite transporter FocA (FNT family)
MLMSCFASSVTFTVSTLAGRTSIVALLTNLTLSFIGNLGKLLPFPISEAGTCSSLSAAGALFFEGILVYYADATLLSEPYKSFTANLAVTKVRTPGW